MNNIYFAVQFDNGSYWAGNNSITGQIRNARFYSRLKDVRYWADSALKRMSKLSSVKSYKIISVTISILGEVKDD